MEMPPKDVRKAEADIMIVLSSKSHLTGLQVFNELKGIESLYREIGKPGGGKIYLSNKANDSFLRLVGAVGEYLPSRDFVGRDDIYRACKTVVGALCEEGARKLDAQSFINAAEKIIAATIQPHRFYTTLDGMHFEDFTELEVGRLSIHKSDLTILQKSEAHQKTRDSLWRGMGEALWITGEITGSHKECERIFFENVKLACGLLTLSLAMAGEWGVVGQRLAPCMDTRSRPSTSSWFSIATESKQLCASTSWGGNSLQRLEKKFVSELLERDWFQNLIGILQGDGKSDVEQAIQRGVYWYFDAQMDTSLEMQMVKFWSCIECIFSFMNDGQTTKSIRNGMVGMFILGGYRLVDEKEMTSLRSQIKALYELRCGAVHDAKHNHVSQRDVALVSKWAAWVMIEVAGLAVAGFKTRKEIKIQTDYWFEKLQGQSTPTAEKCPTCGSRITQS